MERVMVFIDSSNLYHGLQNELGHANIDYAKFVDLLIGDRKLITAYFYAARVIQQEVPEQYSQQQRFFEYIRSLPYFKLREGRLVRRGDHVVEKAIDVKIAVDMLVQAFRDTYDTAILVTGDGDLAVAADEVSEMGKHVENAYFRIGRSRELENACHRFVELDVGLLRPCCRS